MSGKARLGAGGAKQAPAVRREDLDDNVSTYQLEADGRSAEERVHQVRLDRIEPSPFQVRRVFPETEIEELANSIRDNGLVHAPKGRPHPEKPGWVELMPGEMRLRALQRLIERGEADALLKRDREGNWLIPIVVVTVEDERAEAIVFAENEARTDLSRWEWALAWQQRRDRRDERGQPAAVRDIAEAHNKSHTTVGDYIQVADAISLDVLTEAGVATERGIDHSRMALLPLSALKGVAKTRRDHGVGRAAAHLRRELAKAKRKQEEERRGAPGKERDRGAGKGSFQINIRQPLPELTSRQAIHYLGRISEALPILAQKAVEDPDRAGARDLAASLEAVVQLLRGGG